jgi:hypothetical protein
MYYACRCGKSNVALKKQFMMLVTVRIVISLRTAPRASVEPLSPMKVYFASITGDH